MLNIHDVKSRAPTVWVSRTAQGPKVQRPKMHNDDGSCDAAASTSCDAAASTGCDVAASTGCDAAASTGCDAAASALLRRRLQEQSGTATRMKLYGFTEVWKGTAAVSNSSIVEARNMGQQQEQAAGAS